MSENASVDILDFSSKKKKKTKISEEMTPNADAQETLEFGTKKKKKVKTVNDESVSLTEKNEESVHESTKKKKVSSGDAEVGKLADQLDEELYFSSKKKKSKKKGLMMEDLAETEANEGNTDATYNEISDVSGFTYDMLLSRVFAQLGALNPELVSDQKRRLVMVPPQMARIGTKKTLFVNFAAICRSLNRDQSHLTAYILAELGTQGSVDANGALLIRGRYLSKHLEPVLRNYCRNYVLCGTCQYSETELCKDSRLLFLNCRRCGSRFTVKSVTSGFQAVTGKRAALRAKAQ